MSLKETLARARTLLEVVSTPVLDVVPTPELVRLGSDLMGLGKLVKDLVEGVKAEIRNRTPSVPGQHHLSGPGAMCQVTVPGPQPVLRKDVPLADLRAALGADFDRLFSVTEEAVPREDFEETLGLLDPDRVTILLAALDITTPKARVSFHQGVQSSSQSRNGSEERV